MSRLEIIREKYLKRSQSTKIESDLANNYDLTMLYFSHVAYNLPYKISTSLKRTGAQKVCVYNYEDTQAFLAEYENFAIVSFRGIENWDDLKIILRFWKKDFGGMVAHAGCIDNIKKVSRSLIKDLEEVPRNKRLIFTGHSMGGALALLLSLHFKPTEICVFGTPKIGAGAEFRAHFEDIPVRRIRTSYDSVHYMPWNIPVLADYEHVGVERIIMGVPMNPWESHKLSTYRQSLLKEKRNLSLDTKLETEL